MLRRGALVAAFAAAVLLPTATASGASQVKLAVVPLPKSALGAAGRSLSLARDSGVVTNTHAAAEATKVTPDQLKRLGRVTGYRLDYGDPFDAGPGVTAVRTEISRYRSAASARNGLAFWRRDELKPLVPKKFATGVSFSLHPIPFSGVPGPRWAYGLSITVKGLKALHSSDAEFQQGPYVLEVSVTGSSAAAVARLGSALAHELSHRLALAQAGRLAARPVALPPPLKPGPPAHGPKPADMVLTKADVGSPSTIRRQHYTSPKDAGDQYASSAFDLEMSPAGRFDNLVHEVLVAASEREAKYFAAIAVGQTVAVLGKAPATPVDLSGVGDHARAALVQQGNGAGGAAVIALCRGPYLGFIIAQSFSPLSTADVRKLARLAVKRLDAGFAR